MLTMGQRILAFGTLAFIFAVSFSFSPFFSILLIPICIVLGIMLWKL